MAPQPNPAKFPFAVGVDGSTEFAADVPSWAFPFLLRAPTCVSVCSYSVCWV